MSQNTDVFKQSHIHYDAKRTLFYHDTTRVGVFPCDGFDRLCF